MNTCVSAAKEGKYSTPQPKHANVRRALNGMGLGVQTCLTAQMGRYGMCSPMCANVPTKHFGMGRTVRRKFNVQGVSSGTSTINVNAPVGCTM